MRKALLLLVLPLSLGGCFSYSETPAPPRTTVVVPPGAAVVCPTGLPPPC
jgi:hypothetical protein